MTDLSALPETSTAAPRKRKLLHCAKLEALLVHQDLKEQGRRHKMDGTSIAQGKAQDQEMRRLRKLAMLRRQQEQLAALEAELALCKENVGQKPRKLSEATKGVVNKTAPLTPSRKGGNKGNAFAPSAPEQDYFTFEPPAHLPGDKNSSHNLKSSYEQNLTSNEHKYL